MEHYEEEKLREIEKYLSEETDKYRIRYILAIKNSYQKIISEKKLNAN